MILVNVIIYDVTFIPKPVIPKTPTIKDAQRIIDAIIATWCPANNVTLMILVFVFFKLKLKLMSINRRRNPDKIAKAAENWGVYPTYINNNKIENGIRKKSAVLVTIVKEGNIFVL